MFPLPDKINKMDTTLANIADYSNAISIAVIIGCFISMAVFILRLNLHGKVDTHPGDWIPGRAMKGVHNPYTLQLDPGRNSTLRDGVWLEMTCKAPCIVQALWGVSISHVYPAIYLRWEDFYQQILNDSWLEEHISYRDTPRRYQPTEKVRIRLKVPDEVDLRMGQVPRTKYPLIVILLHADCDTEPLNSLCVTSHVSIFHLKDDECPGKSNILCQYIRTPIGTPCMLQQLFVASADEGLPSDGMAAASSTQEQPSGTCNAEQNATERETEEQASSHGMCIVCQEHNINRALLPCRHVCVCDQCFLRLDKCPMCRSFIESYFQLSPNEQIPYMDQQVEEEEGYPKPWWEQWNNRINAFFGFR